MRMRFCAVLATSMLFLAPFASVAFAQATAEGGDTNITIVDCSQVQNAVANQGQYGNANAAANDESEATAEIAQELNISQSQVNACLGQIGGGGGGDNNNTPAPNDKDNDGGDDEDDSTAAPNGEGDDSGDGDVQGMADGEDQVIGETVIDEELPETGGPSLFAAAAGLALIVGGTSLLRAGRGR